MFRRRKPETDFATALYGRVAEQARAAELFEACGIPDTLDGRFDALALHAALVIDRLRAEPDGEALAQALFDAMFRHLDLTLREIGVGDRHLVAHRLAQHLAPADLHADLVDQRAHRHPIRPEPPARAPRAPHSMRST